MSVLEKILADTREEVRDRRRDVPLAELESRISGRHDDRPFAEALVGEGVSVIAEHKRRSPSAGTILEGGLLEQIVGAYERGGAAALSIITEPHHFGGALADLDAARAVTTLPLLRKDFIVDPYQLYEAAAHGADAVLLIVAALDDDELRELYAEATALDLDVLVEVHSQSELARALEFDPQIIGINNRDLRDFSVDVERTHTLLADVPAGKTVVSESGFHSREQIDELERVGVDAVLIGSSLMRSGDPEAALAALTEHGSASP